MQQVTVLHKVAAEGGGVLPLSAAAKSTKKTRGNIVGGGGSEQHPHKESLSGAQQRGKREERGYLLPKRR